MSFPARLVTSRTVCNLDESASPITSEACEAKTSSQKQDKTYAIPNLLSRNNVMHQQISSQHAETEECRRCTCASNCLCTGNKVDRCQSNKINVVAIILERD